jgi:hypothetical protein
VRLYYILPQYLINGTIFENKFLNIKCVFLFFLKLLLETYLIQRKTARDMIKNIYWASSQVPVILVRFEWISKFLDRFSNDIEISNFTKIRPVKAELFHANRRTGRHTDKAKLIVAFHNFANAPKKTILRTLSYSDIYFNEMIQQNKFHIHIFIVVLDDGSKTSHRNIMFNRNMKWCSSRIYASVQYHTFAINYQICIFMVYFMKLVAAQAIYS